MNPTLQRNDPIRKRYYGSVKAADAWSDRLFYVTALLSFLPFVFEKSTYSIVYGVTQCALLLSAMSMFAVGLIVRLHLWPRAEEMRRKDMLSHAYELSLTHERTTGYYNNDESSPDWFVAAAVLENAFHSKSILLEMAKHERVKCAVYLLTFFGLLMFNPSDLAVLTTAGVAIFSEQIISRYARVEWLRIKCEEIYDSLYGLLQADPTRKTIRAYAMQALTTYESTKSNAGIVLSEAIFLKRQASLADEWEQIKKALGI